ncbi:MAG TPA: TlpA disulfide reductase family protein [Blastocatellia bacterium]|jgi:thiol-disulfide isomerase/thioredoxin|nr:TlpA disulfide reductase family protein [Blastocatellia bacterium]
MKAKQRILLLAIAPALLSITGLGQAIATNDYASLSLKDTTGQQRTLHTHRGKIVVLNFWATWCRPCREELPILNSLDSRYRERGVDFIAASVDGATTRKNIPAFLRKLKLTFPVWVGATKSDMEKLGLGNDLPATIVIDSNGAIVGRILGVVGHADLQKRLEWLLGDRETPPPPPLVNNHRTP